MSKKEVFEGYKWSKKDINGKDFEVEGKIIKEEELYHWYVSHLYRPSPAATCYYRPSNTASTKAIAEQHMNAYVNGFTEDIIIDDIYIKV
jgi:hypothetical protein